MTSIQLPSAPCAASTTTAAAHGSAAPAATASAPRQRAVPHASQADTASHGATDRTYGSLHRTDDPSSAPAASPSAMVARDDAPGRKAQQQTPPMSRIAPYSSVKFPCSKTPGA